MFFFSSLSCDMLCAPLDIGMYGTWSSTPNSCVGPVTVSQKLPRFGHKFFKDTPQVKQTQCAPCVWPSASQGDELRRMPLCDQVLSLSSSLQDYKEIDVCGLSC